MKLRAGFMGSPAFAVPYLDAVRATCELRVVVCQPDKPAGRGRTLTPPAIKTHAQDFGVPIVQPHKMKDGSLVATLSTHELDVLVVVAFGRILPPELLALPTYGCLNVHASRLPRWRGAAPIQRAILAGDTVTGVCIMAMDEGLDTGPLYVTHDVDILPGETSGALFDRLAVMGAPVLQTFLQAFPNVPAAQPQPSEGVTYAAPLGKHEGQVDWQRSARELACHVRGMDPWPVAFTHRRGEVLKLFGASCASIANANVPAGGVLACSSEHGLCVQTADGALAIAQVQPPGKRRMPAHEYARGKPFAPEERLGLTV